MTAKFFPILGCMLALVSARTLYSFDVLDERLVEARSAWKKLESDYDRLVEGEITLVTKAKQGNLNSESIEEASYRRRGDNLLFEAKRRDYITAKGNVSRDLFLLFRNDQYSAELARTDAEKKWHVKRINLKRDDLHEWRRQTDFAFRKFIIGKVCPSRLHGTSLEEIVFGEGASVQAVRDLDNGLVRIEVHQSYAKDSKTHYARRSCVIEVNPKFRWRLEKGSFETNLPDNSAPSYTVVTVSYPESGDENALPLPNSVRLVETIPKPQIENVMEITCSLQTETGSRPLREFTLSNFGMPEPPQTTVLNSVLPYWIFGTIGGACLIGLGFYLRSRKTAQTK